MPFFAIAEVTAPSLGVACWHALVLGVVQGLTEFLPIPYINSYVKHLYRILISIYSLRMTHYTQYLSLLTLNISW